MYGCGKGCLIFIPFRLPQISCFTLSLKYFSSDSDNCPAVGIRPLLQFPHPLRAGPILLTLLCFPLVPLSSRVLRASIYSFPLVRYSSLLSAGVLHTPSVSEGVFLKCPWREMNCMLPTPLSSCSPLFLNIKFKRKKKKIFSFQYMCSLHEYQGLINNCFYLPLPFSSFMLPYHCFFD